MKYVKTLLSVYICVFLSMGLFTMFNVSIVKAIGTNSTDFEDGTLNTQYSNSWLTSSYVAGYVEVDNNEVWDGVKSFMVAEKEPNINMVGWWNYTVSSNVIATWSAIWCPDLNTDCDFFFYNSTLTEIIHIKMDYDGSHNWYYYDHNGDTQFFGTNIGETEEFGWRIIDSDTVYYWANTNNTPYLDYIIGEPRNVGIGDEDSIIYCKIFQYASASMTSITSLDLHNVTFSDSYSSYNENPEIPEGDTTINVYNESSPTIDISSWNLIVYNEYGAIWYSANNLSNPTTISHSIYGTGEIYFEISADGYNNRTYYANIVNGVHYTLDAFLAYENYTHLYYIQVQDSRTAPIYDAEIHITKALNGSLQEISSGFTNGYGMFYVWLIANNNYRINISKNNYEDLILQHLIADPDNYGIEFPIIYRLIYDTEEIIIRDILMDNMTLYPYNSTTMQIVYWNFNNSNDFVTFDVYDLIGDTLLKSYNISTNPNNISILFDFSAYDLDGDILKVVAHPYRLNGEVFTIIKYFNINQASRGAQTASAAIAAIFSIGVCLFGFTISHPKKTFGAIGIIVMVIAIGITAFAVQTWYIHLIQAMEIVLLMFILLVFKEEGVHAV